MILDMDQTIQRLPTNGYAEGISRCADTSKFADRFPRERRSAPISESEYRRTPRCPRDRAKRCRKDDLGQRDHGFGPVPRQSVRSGRPVGNFRIKSRIDLLQFPYSTEQGIS
jgi:hypothetical protein